MELVKKPKAMTRIGADAMVDVGGCWWIGSISNIHHNKAVAGKGVVAIVVDVVDRSQYLGLFWIITSHRAIEIVAGGILIHHIHHSAQQLDT
jgi:hypothetical protein